MSKKTLSYICVFPLLFGLLQAKESKSDVDPIVVSEGIHDTILDGFFNIKFAHERNNGRAFGPKNSSAVALNPVLTIGNFIFESDFYYGRQFTYSGFLGGQRHISRLIDADRLSDFYENFNSDNNDVNIRKKVSSVMRKNVGEAHFYRTYTRLTYENKEHDIRMIVGDTVPRNFVGFQQALSGVGISIFRQSGNSSTINNSSPIVITKLSKVECKLGNEILCIKVFAPGIYTVDDLPEEAKLPGVTLKISDQLNRSEVLTIDYFCGYGLLEKGKDDFDVTLLFTHKWDVLDPHKLKYKGKPHFTANYRYGIRDNITAGGGIQYHDNEFLLDYTMIFATKIGTISPNIAFSHKSPDGGKNKDAFGAGLFYAIPKNNLGISLEIFGGIKGSGFVDMCKGSDSDDAYLAIMNKCFPDLANKRMYRGESSDDSFKQLFARIYTTSILGVVPSFIFNGEWASSHRLREYTLAITKKLFNRIMITVSAGITYDDPYKGPNQQSPDRRLTVLCTIPVGRDFKLVGEYYHHDDDRLRNHAKIQYNPSEIPGLEVIAEEYFMPGYRAPCASVKYDGKYFNVKAEESIKNVYECEGKKASHTNQQRFFFGTSLSPSKIRAYQKTGFNVLRSIKDKK